jgi:predicted glycoside hydrolase/deacetylase ChbG (UPF0249 family)
MKVKTFYFVLPFFLFSLLAGAQERNLAQLLGYPADSKLLIIHGDDLGLSNSVNMANFDALGSNSITSASMMVPCPWAYDAALYLKNHPGPDVGIHLTLTAEWESYKWDGVCSSDQISSLLDPNGYLYPSVEQVAAHVNAAEAEKELKAQIEKLISWGIKPSHIDTHMGSVMAKPELVKIYLNLSDQYNIPVLFPREYAGMLPPDVSAVYSKKIFLLDNLFMLDTPLIGDKWIDAYRKAIAGLKPGLNQIIVHVAIDNAEMQEITRNHDAYGSAWRQNDLNMLKSDEFKNLLKENKIVLIKWGQIRDLMQSGK